MNKNDIRLLTRNNLFIHWITQLMLVAIFLWMVIYPVNSAIDFSTTGATGCKMDLILSLNMPLKWLCISKPAGQYGSSLTSIHREHSCGFILMNNLSMAAHQRMKTPVPYLTSL